VGDIMVDTCRVFSEVARQHSEALAKFNVEPKKYSLLTLHRQENVDDQSRLTSILDGLSQIDQKILFPIHPRTKKKIEEFSLTLPSNIQLCEPLGYLDMLQLTENSQVVLTDSGGLQKEAYYLKTPCICLRDQTEWVETLEQGANQLVGASEEKIAEAHGKALSYQNGYPSLYGEGNTAERITKILKEDFC
jgi:UDP-GlcNAc3NAcA epimerase